MIMINNADLNKKVLIGAGQGGWEIIEYQELFNSAKEYFGEENIEKISVENLYLHNLAVLLALLRNRYSYYIYSPRTSPQDFVSIIIDSFLIGIQCWFFNVQCICMLSDAPVRKWRYASILSTILNGKIFSLMDKEYTKSLLPSKKTFGPYLLPYSRSTSQYLFNLSRDTPRLNSVFFSGWAYSDRKRIFNHVSSSLDRLSIPYSFSNRSSNGSRNTNDAYFLELSSYTILFTTSSQIQTKNSSGLDRYPHFIYRYLEALLAGNLMVCHYCKGIERYFIPDTHFLAYNDADEAVSQTINAYRNYNDLRSIAIAGQERALELVSNYVFWSDLIYIE